uniref:Uncharacterized protein n=1 Tax=Romanomermis culicivorax TaxID=13658 RepID=A0A915HGA4_ROMCU
MLHRFRFLGQWGSDTMLLRMLVCSREQALVEAVCTANDHMSTLFYQLIIERHRVIAIFTMVSTKCGHSLN